ncbi:MAG: hypothetical protein ABI599_01965 [Flavobacteriales bacterium]
MKYYLLPVLFLLACNAPKPSDPIKPTTDSIATPAPVDSPAVEDGLEQLRTADGRLSMEGYKRKGQRHGVWTSYTQDGRVKSRTAYTDGKLDGDCVVFRENGQLYYQGSYKNGLETGEWKFYGPDGALEKTVQH